MKGLEINSIKSTSSEIFFSDLEEMYNFSGQDDNKITAHSYQRYLKNKETDEEILNLVKNATSDIKEEILNARDQKRFFLINKGLEAEDFEVQKKYTEMIRYAPMSKRFFLINKVIEKGNIVLLKECAVLINFIPEYTERNILQEKVYSLIEKVFNAGDVKIQKLCAELVSGIQRHNVASLIEKGLSVNNVEVQREYSSLVTFSLLEDFEMIPLQKKIDSLIEEGFKTGNVEIQKEHVEMIRNASEDKIFYFIDKFLNINNIEIQKMCASMILRVSRDDERAVLQEKVSSLIEKSFVFGDAKIQKGYVGIIDCAIPNKRFSLIKKGLEIDNIEIQKTCARLISSVPEEDKREGLFKIAKNKLGNALVEAPLYNKNISSESFVRARQEKTGSETTLIGGKLKGKAIIRHIKPEAFLAWQKLYENYKLWKEDGFDYVPIEPILSYKLNKNGLVDVYSGVLDLSLGAWQETNGTFLKELNDDKKEILKVLENNVFKHGHTHDNNFCLRFFRDEKGNVDFNKKPRIYLIDFDQAASF